MLDRDTVDELIKPLKYGSKSFLRSSGSTMINILIAGDAYAYSILTELQYNYAVLSIRIQKSFHVGYLVGGSRLRCSGMYYAYAQ